MDIPRARIFRFILGVDWNGHACGVTADAVDETLMGARNPFEWAIHDCTLGSLLS